ncbi:premnaspirodiene oxygenase-like protein, partial [Tanacetum coccineum]
MLLKLSSSSRTKKSTPCLPPGPWKLPIIGSIHHLGGSLPHQRFKSLAEKYGPLMHLQLGELSVIVVSSPETAKEVMKTHDVNFADRPYLYANTVICTGAKNISFSPYGDYWRRIRKICSQELLSPTRVQSFGPARVEEVSKFIKSISEHVGNQINLSERIISLTYGMTARSAFDLFPSSTLLPILMGFKAKLENIRGRYDEITGNIIKEHQARKVVTVEDEDLVDVLLRYQDDIEFPIVMLISNQSNGVSNDMYSGKGKDGGLAAGTIGVLVPIVGEGCRCFVDACRVRDDQRFMSCS